MSDALFGWIFLPRSSRLRIVVFRSLNIFLSYCHSHSIKFAMEMTQGSKMENNFRMHELDTTELLPLRKMLSFVGHESIARESLSILRVWNFYSYQLDCWRIFSSGLVLAHFDHGNTSYGFVLSFSANGRASFTALPYPFSSTGFCHGARFSW